MKRFAPLLALCLAAVVPAPVCAHPHVWVAVRCAFLFDDEGRIAGLAETWSFDEMYSSFAVNGLDKNRDGALTREELAGLTKTIVEASAAQDNFTTTTVAERPLKLVKAKDAWSAFGPDGRLAVHFTLGLGEPVKIRGESLRVEVKDTDLYADFQFSDGAETAKALPDGCKVTLDDPRKSLPSDPDAVMKALIEGPVVSLTSGLVLACR